MDFRFLLASRVGGGGCGCAALRLTLAGSATSGGALSHRTLPASSSSALLSSSSSSSSSLAAVLSSEQLSQLHRRQRRKDAPLARQVAAVGGCERACIERHLAVKTPSSAGSTSCWQPPTAPATTSPATGSAGCVVSVLPPPQPQSCCNCVMVAAAPTYNLFHPARPASGWRQDTGSADGGESLPAPRQCVERMLCSLSGCWRL